MLTQSEKELYHGYGSAIVGDLEPEEYMPGDQTAIQQSVIDAKSVQVKSKLQKSQHVNLWDISNFSSINNKLPVYPRSNRCFVSFEQQTARPELNRIDVNEARFLKLNQFPESLTTTKHTPQVVFSK